MQAEEDEMHLLLDGIRSKASMQLFKAVLSSSTEIFLSFVCPSHSTRLDSICCAFITSMTFDDICERKELRFCIALLLVVLSEL